MRHAQITWCIAISWCALGVINAHGSEHLLPLVKVAEPLVLAPVDGVQGSVELDYWVSKEGLVQEIVVKEATTPELEVAAIQAVRARKHDPFERDGQILEQHIFQLVQFLKARNGT